MAKLTPTQEKALAFIRSSLDQSGVAPTLREICAHMGYRAVGSAQDVVSALRRKGFLVEQGRQAARSIVPTERGARGLAQALAAEMDAELFVVPCLGTVPAGNPIEAIEDHTATLSLSKTLLPKPLPRPEELFALRASGESMIGAGIFDGDWLIVRTATEAPKDSIVVARVEGEVTVKRLRHSRQGWFLAPENPKFAPIFAEQQSFALVGMVLALQRSL